MKPDLFDNIVDNWFLRIKNKSYFKCCDYTSILNHLKKGDFIYLDPPYFHSKNRYIENLDKDKFFRFINELNKKNILFALSFDGSRDNIKLNEEFPKKLFKRKISINQTISTLNNVLNKKKNKFSDSLYLNY